VPKGLRVKVERLAGSADPFLVPSGHNSSAVAGEVLAEVYGKVPFLARSGGSIEQKGLLFSGDAFVSHANK
jgi:hypothetical protein